MLSKIEAMDAKADVETMLENDRYTFGEAITHIAKCYDVTEEELIRMFN